MAPVPEFHQNRQTLLRRKRCILTRVRFVGLFGIREKANRSLHIRIIATAMGD